MTTESDDFSVMKLFELVISMLGGNVEVWISESESSMIMLESGIFSFFTSLWVSADYTISSPDSDSMDSGSWI
jgi:hypothetical protein